MWASAVLTEAEEAIIIAFRRRTLLPLGCPGLPVLVQLRPVYWPGRELPMTPVTVEVAQPLAMEPGSPVLLAWLMFELVLVSVWLAVLCGGLLVASPGLAGC